MIDDNSVTSYNERVETSATRHCTYVDPHRGGRFRRALFAIFFRPIVSAVCEAFEVTSGRTRGAVWVHTTELPVAVLRRPGAGDVFMHLLRTRLGFELAFAGDRLTSSLECFGVDDRDRSSSRCESAPTALIVAGEAGREVLD